MAHVGRHRTRTGTLVARLHQRRLVAVFGEIEALQQRLGLEALRQGILYAAQVVWLSDGARGLWRLFEAGFTVYASGLLDVYHAVQQRWQSAAAWLDGRTTQARRWFGWARHRLLLPPVTTWFLAIFRDVTISGHNQADFVNRWPQNSILIRRS